MPANNPTQIYRLRSLAQRGFYVPDVIPFEEIDPTDTNALANFKSANSRSQMSTATGRMLPGQIRPGSRTRLTGLNLIPLQEILAQEPAGPGNSAGLLSEIQSEDMVRKGIY